ncbi:hypothetical protein ACWC4D_24315 [Streptomyces sp. NPDC001288]|uniref:hypothetical protein n=1 Tax=Streptomyces sp. NPDC001297 TaxID=3364559 RepID=UPI0036957829
MSGAPYLIDDSARSEDADLWFALPPGFVPLPLEELTAVGRDPAEATAQSAALGPVLRLARLLLEAGAVRCCLGLHSDDEGGGGPLLSLFTLAWRDTRWAPRSVLAARAVCGAADNADRVEILDLPCGPGSLVETHVAAARELGPTVPCRLLQIAAYIPCADGRRIAVLSLATTHTEQASHYRALLTDIAGTVSFENPFPEVSSGVSDKD